MCPVLAPTGVSKCVEVSLSENVAMETTTAVDRRAAARPWTRIWRTITHYAARILSPLNKLLAGGLGKCPPSTSLRGALTPQKDPAPVIPEAIGVLLGPPFRRYHARLLRLGGAHINAPFLLNFQLKFIANSESRAMVKTATFSRCDAAINAFQSSHRIKSSRKARSPPSPPTNSQPLPLRTPTNHFGAGEKKLLTSSLNPLLRPEKRLSQGNLKDGSSKDPPPPAPPDLERVPR